MTWVYEEALPFVPTAMIFFSPIIVNDVYISDAGVEFWRYNHGLRLWTPLTPTNFSRVNCRPTLTLSPDRTKLACITDRDGVAHNLAGSRIEVYTIATDVWVASSQAPWITGAQPNLQAIVWENEDTIWAWVMRGVTQTGKCFRYIISTDTWTQFAVLHAPAVFRPSNAAMNATDIYAFVVGASGNSYCKYNIAGDNYADTGVANRSPGMAYDRDKLWYVDTTTYRQGYIDTVDDSQHDNQFIENPDRDAGYGNFFGVRDNLRTIIAWARLAPPRLMSEGTYFPIVQTDPATEIT